MMNPHTEDPSTMSIGQMRKKVLDTVRQDNAIAAASSELVHRHLIALQNLLCPMQMACKTEKKPTAHEVDWMVELLQGRQRNVDVSNAVQFLKTIPVERHPPLLQVIAQGISIRLKVFAAILRKGATSEGAQVSLSNEEIIINPSPTTEVA